MGTRPLQLTMQLAHPACHPKGSMSSAHDTVLHPVAKTFKEERPLGFSLD